MQLKIKFFGKTKELEPSGFVIMNFEKNISIRELRTVLIEKLSETKGLDFVTALINDCALGNTQQILPDDHLICDCENLVLLPPVCGG